VQLVHPLKLRDHQQWLNDGVRIQAIAREDNNFIHNLIVDDKIHFRLNGFVNEQNIGF